MFPLIKMQLLVISQSTTCEMLNKPLVTVKFINIGYPQQSQYKFGKHLMLQVQKYYAK